MPLMRSTPFRKLTSLKQKTPFQKNPQAGTPSASPSKDTSPLMDVNRAYHSAGKYPCSYTFPGLSLTAGVNWKFFSLSLTEFG